MAKKLDTGSNATKTKVDQKTAIEMIKAAAAARAAGGAGAATQDVPGYKTAQAPGGQQGVPFDFKKIHLHIGIPCYGGMVSEPTMTSFLRFVLMATQVGLNWSLDTMVNESLVTRARNNLMAKMMTNTNATHFMFIDADIRFQPESIFQMIACDKDVIGGLYPKKALPVNYVINLQPQTKIQGDIFTVDTMGTGFLLFKRHVYQKLIEAHPETKYVDDVGLGKQYEPMMYAIFDVAIDHKGHYLSEDWLFCRRWAALGGEIWAHGKVLLNHVGHYEFQGDLSKMPQFGSGAQATEEAAKQLPDAAPAALKDALAMAQKQTA
jgi:hypothetical protein